jgi:hypothetical protein
MTDQEEIILIAIACVADDVIRDMKIAWGNQYEEIASKNRVGQLELLVGKWKAGKE